MTVSWGDFFARASSARITRGELCARAGLPPNTSTGLRGSAGFDDHTAPERKMLLGPARGARSLPTRGGLALVASATSAAETSGVWRLWIVAPGISPYPRSRGLGSPFSLLSCLA